MATIRRLALAALVALFITLGTTAPIAATDYPIQPQCTPPWEPDPICHQE